MLNWILPGGGLKFLNTFKHSYGFRHIHSSRPRRTFGDGWDDGGLDLMSLMELDVVVAATGKATSLKDDPAIVSV